MDTTQYSNILQAIKGKDTAGGLSTADRVENYNLLEKLNAEGKRLSDILKQAEEHRDRPDDPEIFGIMESEVKNEQEVKDARQRLADTKTMVLARICYQHPEYRQAMDEYRKIVTDTYKAKRGDSDPLRRKKEQVAV